MFHAPNQSAMFRDLVEENVMCQLGYFYVDPLCGAVDLPFYLDRRCLSSFFCFFFFLTDLFCIYMIVMDGAKRD